MEGIQQRSAGCCKETTMTKLTTRIDITKTPFGKYGSWVSITSASNTGALKIVNVHEIFGDDQAMILEFEKNGQSITHSIDATPALISAKSCAGDVRIYMKGDDGFVVESNEPELVFRSLDNKIGKYWPRVVPEMPIVKDKSGATRKVVDVKKDTFAVIDIIQGSAVDGKDRITVSPEDGKAVVLFRFDKNIPSAELPSIDIDADIAEVESEWSAFLAKMPDVPADRRSEAEQAWHIMWCAFARAGGNLAADTMFVNKNYMTAAWSWDHCFHALGMARGDFQAGLNQLLSPFYLQDETGKMPDVWKSPDVAWFGITKPPVHGWCLLKLMEIQEVDIETLKWFYPRLVKWTEYWFKERDEDNDGVPNYTEDGCDSGMDNSTVYDVGGRLETPDLSAYLVIQMKALAVVARKLGDEKAAKNWESRAAKLLEGLYEHCWKNDRFVCVKSGTHEFDPEPTASLPIMPLVLGSDLDKDKFDKCVAELETRFLTDYGIASEEMSSKKYEADSYWRGPIWAPQVYLIADGLKRGGRADLAKEVATRYCDMIKYQAGGNFENFDSRTGRGNRANGFSWSAAVNLVCMWEFLM